MATTHQNDTYGELTATEHQALRDAARTCVRCGMLATVDPVLHQGRYGHAPQYWQGMRLWTWTGSSFEVEHDNRPVYRVTFQCGRHADVRATSEQDARDQAQTGPSVHIVRVDLAPHRVGHHAEAHTAEGRLLVYRPSMAGEVLADFPSGRTTLDPYPEDGGLSQARAWAQRVLDEHPLAMSVSIRESWQPRQGAMWNAGPGVETIRRDETATPVPLPGFAKHDHHVARVVRPGPVSEDTAPSWLVAAQCPAGTWMTALVVRDRGRLLWTQVRYFQRAEVDNQAAALAHLDGMAA